MLVSNTSSNPDALKPAMDETVDSSTSPSTTKLDSYPTLTGSAIYTDETFDWKKIDSLRFVVQVGLSLIVMALCISKLTLPAKSSNGDVDKALYWGGITGIMAWWMPSPGNSKNASKPESK